MAHRCNDRDLLLPTAAPKPKSEGIQQLAFTTTQLKSKRRTSRRSSTRRTSRLRTPCTSAGSGTRCSAPNSARRLLRKQTSSMPSPSSNTTSTGTHHHRVLLSATLEDVRVLKTNPLSHWSHTQNAHGSPTLCKSSPRCHSRCHHRPSPLGSLLVRCSLFLPQTSHGALWSLRTERA